LEGFVAKTQFRRGMMQDAGRQADT